MSNRTHFRSSDGEPKREMTREEAERKAERGPDTLFAYPCRACDAWHVGNLSGTRSDRRGKLTKRQIAARLRRVDTQVLAEKLWEA